MEGNDNESAGALIDGREVRYASIVPLIGGFTIGNSMATGNKPIALYTYNGFQENEKHLRAYWPDVPYINLDEDGGLPVVTEDRLDFVSTTCPCAGLSMLNYSKGGTSKSRGADAAQNEWMYRSARFVLGTLKPRVFFGENAPGLYGEVGKGVVDKLFEIAQENGYSMSLMKTSTIRHGIPQERSRTFYFFWDSEYAPVLNTYNREHKKLGEYLSEVPKDASLMETFNNWKLEGLPIIKFVEEVKGVSWKEMMADEDSRTMNWYIVKNGWLDECIEYTDKVLPGSVDARSLHHIKKKLAEGKGFWDVSPRLGNDHFNAVISKNMICGSHPEEKRFITIREYMHLMGLPHDFELLDKNQWNHIAQNVPTATARDWTLEVVKYIKGELPSSGQKFFRQSNLSATKADVKEKSTCLF
jgi:site-specific DNA-cytosine methylase